MTTNEFSSESKKPTSIERERKYLVRHLPENLDCFNHEEFMQGYVLDVPGQGILRIRREGNEFVMTFKGMPVDGDTSNGRLEIEKLLTEEEFAQMWPLTEGRRLEKIRYYIPLDEGRIAELDIFAEGGALVEVEFTSEEDLLDFTPPDWFGRNVSGDKNYGNLEISVNGFPEDV